MRATRLLRRTFGALLAAAIAAPAMARAQAPEPGASAWPNHITVDGASVTVYQPQAITWPDHKILTARAAVAITPPDAKAPILGTVEVSLDTDTDLATRTVILSDPKLDASRFPALDTGQAARLEEKVRAALPHLHMRPVPLDSVLLSLKETPEAKSVAVDNTPPVIFHSDKPASLVVFDGEPVLAPAGQSGLSFAANTNWAVFSDGKAWYLLNNGIWFAAPAATGPYAPTTKLPPAFNAIPHDANFTDVRSHLPPRAASTVNAPTIFVSTKPAEIIVIAGPPQFAAVEGTSLQRVTNTASTLFFDPSQKRFYYLVSGRWFAAPSLDGPWVFATNDLPPEFALIQPDGPNGQVLASVPNTAQSQLAVLQAQIPQEATLRRDRAKLTVTYVGPPRFKPIPGTPIQYATNTLNEVLEVNGHYYACYQGAWFVAPTPTGPWTLAESVPPVIYTIPPSVPPYNVTYVTVRAATPAAVTFAYTAGYMMAYPASGVVVYGTGYYYPPVVVPGPVPAYLPYPYTYAGNVAYNPTTGAWTRGGTVYGPYGGAATGGSYYNPSTGAWARGGAVYGPNGGAGAWSAYNPSTGSYARGSASWNAYGGSANASFYNARTGVSGSTNQNYNAYQRWGSSVLTGPNQTVQTRSASNAQGSAGGFRSSTGAEGAGYAGVNGNRGGAVRTANGDVYAGRDGNAYQHTSSGWSKWENGGWQPVQTPTASSAGQRRQAPASQTHPATLGGTQGTQGRFQNRAASPGAGTGYAGRLDSGSYQQLEQDRQARMFGEQRQFGGFRQAGAGGASREFGFGGGRFRR
ncbi:MAG TPA: hypothetical protein VJ779_10565 [Acetobacteraceae bacterium]|nr:hypothetical protein [Acetobacteraceae bacterium]